LPGLRAAERRIRSWRIAAEILPFIFRVKASPISRETPILQHNPTSLDRYSPGALGRASGQAQGQATAPDAGRPGLFQVLWRRKGLVMIPVGVIAAPGADLPRHPSPADM